MAKSQTQPLRKHRLPPAADPIVGHARYNTYYENVLTSGVNVRMGANALIENKLDRANDVPPTTIQYARAGKI